MAACSFGCRAPWAGLSCPQPSACARRLIAGQHRFRCRALAAVRTIAANRSWTSSSLANSRAPVAGFGAGASLAGGWRGAKGSGARGRSWVWPRCQTFAPDIERGTGATSVRPSFPRPWQPPIGRRILSRRFGRRPRLNRTARRRTRSPLRSPSMSSCSGRNGPYWRDSDHARPSLIPRQFGLRHSRNCPPCRERCPRDRAYRGSGLTGSRPLATPRTLIRTNRPNRRWSDTIRQGLRACSQTSQQWLSGWRCRAGKSPPKADLCL